MPFLYGNHIVKAHLGRITEDTPEHQGVVVFSMNDTPLVRHSPWAFSLILTLSGIWSHCKINNRHSKARPNRYHSVPSSVRDRFILTSPSHIILTEM
jgi:hypothetical protein